MWLELVAYLKVFRPAQCPFSNARRRFLSWAYMANVLAPSCTKRQATIMAIQSSRNLLGLVDIYEVAVRTLGNYIKRCHEYILCSYTIMSVQVHCRFMFIITRISWHVALLYMFWGNKVYKSLLGELSEDRSVQPFLYLHSPNKENWSLQSSFIAKKISRK